MITLEKYEAKYRTGLEYYPLSDLHLSFTAHPLELLDRSENAPTYTPIVIVEDGQVAGFFVLDTGKDKLQYTDDQESILLRGYSIHPAYQGRGIAKKSLKLLPEFTTIHFSETSQIVLGLDEVNKAAQSVYLQSGFIDGGKRVVGRSGMQIGMCLKL